MTKCKSSGYLMVSIPGHDRAHKNGYVYEHIAMAGKALGKPLPEGVVIHHYGERDDNTQIVICENQKYHLLLHTRTRALRACGHASWRKCKFCRRYDDLDNLYISPSGNQVYHRKCVNIYNRKRRGGN